MELNGDTRVLTLLIFWRDSPKSAIGQSTGRKLLKFTKFVSGPKTTTDMIQIRFEQLDSRIFKLITQCLATTARPRQSWCKRKKLSPTMALWWSNLTWQLKKARLMLWERGTTQYLFDTNPTLRINVLSTLNCQKFWHLTLMNGLPSMGKRLHKPLILKSNIKKREMKVSLPTWM